jgi:hypothetical protein
VRRTLAVALGSALLALGQGCAQQVVADVAALADEAGEAVWLVDAMGCGWRSRGSAFAIDNRHLVTNRHVVANDSSPVLRSRDGRELTGRVIGAKAHPDVALIEVDTDLGKNLEWAPTSALHTREPVVVIGYPRPEHRFKTSTGQLVQFQGTKREAALSNAPIDFGNSGGPGLRADGSVSGLVTQMTLRDDPSERVAILFTAGAVESSLAAFLAKPSKVLSTCGLGPDYVPPVPPSYDIDEAPPDAEPVQEVSLPTEPPPATKAPQKTVPVATVAVAPTTAPVTPQPCPEGRAVAVVQGSAASEDPDEPGTWIVDVRGEVTNESTRNVFIERIDVRFASEPDPIVVAATPSRQALEPNGFSGWVMDDVEVRSSQEPTPDRIAATPVYRWSSGGFAHCPTA